MDISADIEIINAMLERVKNPNIRSSIKDLLARLKKNGAEERISIEQYNKEIDQSLEQVRNGEYITQEELEKKSFEWLK